jgi:uncharacterized protein (DUF2141 family)
MSAIAALFLAVQSIASPQTRGTVSIVIVGARNAHGTIRACITRNPAHFPDCSRDPATFSRTVKASAATSEFSEMPSGDYAVAVFHDENDNGKLDTFLGIPKEGFGFSRNPKNIFGAPRFEQVDIRITPGFSRLSARVQYLL